MSAIRAIPVALALVLLWQACVLLFEPPAFILPGPLRVLQALGERPDLWQLHAMTTLAESVLGLVLGTLAGIGLALVASLMPRLGRIILPVTVVSQAIPVFAIAPLLVLWFGFGLGSKVVMATVAIFFPVASALADGLARADPNLIDLARLHRAGRAREVLLLRWPSALPALVTGIRLAAVYAPVGALFGEWVGASSGLGYAMLHANGRAETDVVFASIFLLAAMSLLLRAAVDRLTRDVAPWAPETIAGFPKP